MTAAFSDAFAMLSEKPSGDEPRLRYSAPVTLVGGGPRRLGDLEMAMSVAPTVVCADGGANGLSDVAPEAIVGDLDSLDDAARWRETLGDRLIEINEQDSTDLEKCLRVIAAPLVVGVGFLGGRLDHLLAAGHALVSSERPAVLIGDEDIAFAPGLNCALELKPGDRFSIFPMKPVTGLRSEGLRWSVEGLSLNVGGRIGTSNEVAAKRVRVSFDRPGALIIVPKARFASVVASYA